MKKEILLLLTGGVLLASCSHKQTSTKAELEGWGMATTVETYEKAGNHNPKWDEAARQALTEFARLRANQDFEPETRSANIGRDAQNAVNDGCDDPLVRYLYCRFAPSHATKSLEYWQEEWRKTASAMEGSSYHSLRKFYANDRAANALWANHDTNLWREISQFRQAAAADFAVALQDKTLPIEEISDAFYALSDTISRNNQALADAWNLIEQPLFNTWPHTSAAWFIKGWFTYKMAWAARGGGWASEVSKDGWTEFNAKLGEAEKAYRKAWSLNPKDPRIPTQMIEMAVSQQKDRPEMEFWFQRAMKLNTNNYDACRTKLRYLSPKWYGSREEMLEFGRECVASTNWGWRVPLILVEAHHDFANLLNTTQRKAYWRQPEVWLDLQSAYEKFFQLNPDVKEDYRYYYADYAYRAGQWRTFKEQIKIIREQDKKVNYEFWGGREKFDQYNEQAELELDKIKH